MQRRGGLSKFFAVVAALILTMASSPQVFAQDHSQQLKGEVDTGAYKAGATANDFTAQVARLYGFEYASSGGKVLPATVSQVMLKGSAWAAGLKAGDKILFANVNANSLSLIVERNNALLQAKLMKPGIAQAGQQPVALRSTLTTLDAGTLDTQQQRAILSARQVAIVIDRSASMGSPDCPGGLTRWDWCAQQVRGLTQQTDACLSNGITVLLFSDGVTRFDHVNASTVPGIFSSNQPEGITRTDLALMDVLNTYLAGPPDKLPLAVAVITDGEPTYPGALEKVIIDATQMMSNPNQISVTFLKVGPEIEGDALLSQMDRDLVSYGAKYDIVSHKSFLDLQRIGLIGALIQSITQPKDGQSSNGLNASAPAPHRPVTLMNPPPQTGSGAITPAAFRQQPFQMQNFQRTIMQQQAQQQQLQDIRQQRNDIERQLLGN